MKIPTYFLLIALIFSCSPKPSLEDKIREIVKDKNLKIGVAAMDLKSNKIVEINGNEKFPMQSVYKYHIAVKTLDEVEKGKLSLMQTIAVKSSEIHKNTWSPLREEFGVKDLSIRLDSLIYYMVSLSDNNACDILLNRIGGPAAVNEYFKNLKIENLNIEATETEMHQDWETQFINWTTPLSLVNTLHKFYLREYLSGDSHNFLWAMMANSPTGKNRIRAGIPADAQVIHKTGTSGRNTQGISAATNDAGFVVLADGSTFIIVIMVTESGETDAVNEAVIAAITKAIINH